MKRIYYIVVDITGAAVTYWGQPPVFFKDDNLGEIRFAVQNNGAAVEAPGLTATCTFLRPDGEPLTENEITAADGFLVCPVKSGVLDAVGTVQGSIEVYSDGNRLTVALFTMVVLDTPANGDTHVPVDLPPKLSAVEQDIAALKDETDGLEAIGAQLLADKEAGVFTGPQGPQGPIGPQGIQGVQGIQGPKGEGFSIAEIYASVAEMEAAAGAGLTAGDFVLIDTGDVEDPENAKLYVWTGTEYSYLTDMSGSQGIQGPEGPEGPQGPAGNIAITELADYDTWAAAVVAGTLDDNTLYYWGLE